MTQAVPPDLCFRHVVFPDHVGGYRRALKVEPAHRDEGNGAAAHAPRQHGPHPLSPEGESFLRWLFDRVGLPFRHYKTETLARRLPACLRAVRGTDVRHARSLILRQPHLAWAAVGMVVIGVTSFFRDAAVFEALREDALPDLLARRCRELAVAGGRGSVAPPLRVWSAGCSDGAELYSVAMLLAEWGALGPGRAELLGTDCRPDAITRAAAGGFDAAALRNVPPSLRERYSTADGSGGFRVSGVLRRATAWRTGDVLAAPEPGPWDVVLCRNLAIYLQPQAAEALWNRLSGALRPGGLLVLGNAERPLGARGLLPVGPCLYRREAGGDADE
jgi:chemotaxis methyl-accepting protein methylase